MWKAMEKQCGIKDDEERWMLFADGALKSIEPNVMWRGVEEGCHILNLPPPSQQQRAYFDSLFNMSWVVWAKMFSDIKNNADIERLSDYIACVCKLKFQ